MAGDWIKIEHVLPDKPEIQVMSALLNIDPETVVGKLCRVWIWADQQSIDGNALSVTDAFLDRLTNCPGFAIAMRKVDWLTGRDLALSFPRFDRHNGQTAKARALTRKRVDMHRNASVTLEPLQERYQRREEKNNSPPTREEVIAHGKIMECPEADCVAFWNHFQSQGWVKSSGLPLSDWRPRLEAWKLEQVRKRSQEGRPEANSNASGASLIKSIHQADSVIGECQAEQSRIRANRKNHVPFINEMGITLTRLSPDAKKSVEDLEARIKEVRSIKIKL